MIELFLQEVVASGRRCRPSSLTVENLTPARYVTLQRQHVTAWYQLAPRIRNARGRWEYAGFLWLEAPDRRPAAIEFLLELHGKRWLVSSFRTAPGSAEIDLSMLPT